MSGTINLHKVAKTGTYSDLIGTPTIPSAPGTLDTTATTTQSTSASESLSGTVTLHKVAKTGKYSDLINIPVIPSAPGTLVTNKTTAQTASSGEAMSGTINLHKVSKTGSYNDLNDKPTIPTIPSLSKGTTSGSGNAVTDISVSGHTITLTKGTTFISTAGAGLSKTGNSLGHSNSVVSPTTEEFRTFKYDAQGHISAATAADEIDFTSFNIVTLSAGFLSRCAYNYTTETSMSEGAVDMGHSSNLVPYKTIPYRTITPSTDPQEGIKK